MSEFNSKKIFKLRAFDNFLALTLRIYLIITSNAKFEPSKFKIFKNFKAY